MKTLKTLIALAVLASSANVAANDWSISIDKGVFTDHFIEIDSDYGTEWNEDNNLWGVEVAKGDWAIQASTFINSYGVESRTVGIEYSVVEWNNIELGVAVGGVKGYNVDEMPVCVGKWCGFIAPTVAYNIEVMDSVVISPTVRIFGAAVVGSVKMTYKF